jgi:hypothetical protein
MIYTLFITFVITLGCFFNGWVYDDEYHNPKNKWWVTTLYGFGIIGMLAFILEVIICDFSYKLMQR